jgi:hypothetical protein
VPAARIAPSAPTVPSEGGKANDTITITSIPDGAKVEWNRKFIGTTPLTYKAGEYAFNARKISLFSKRLWQPVVLRVSKDGYVAREVTITNERFWRSLNGKNSFVYYLVTSNHYEINLDKVSAASAALTNADILRLSALGFGDDLIIDKINTAASAFSLEFDDLAKLHAAGISDAVIKAMMHAK